MDCGVYIIYSKGKFYVGSSIRLKKRITQHKSDLKKNKHFNNKLQNYYNKHGNCFIYSVIKFCNKEDVRFWEQYYIDLFHPYFNIRSSVEGHIITHHTEESKLKISKNNARYWKNKKRSKETISKLKKVKGERHWAWGTKRSVEFGKLISKAKKGTKTSEEVRLKQALSKGARKFSVFKKDTGEFVATYVNRSRCSRELGLLYSKVCACLRGVRKSHKGYVFEYND